MVSSCCSVVDPWEGQALVRYRAVPTMWIANIEDPQSTTRRIFGSFQIALGRKCHGSSPSCARMRASPSYANTAVLQSAVCSCRLTIMTARNGHADRFRSPQSHGSARDASRLRPGITDSERGSPYSWKEDLLELPAQLKYGNSQ